MFENWQNVFSYKLLAIFFIVIVTVVFLFQTFYAVSEKESFTDYSNLSVSDGMSLDKNNVNMILFYAPWCGHCKTLMPNWDRLYEKYDKKQMNGKVINIVKIDCDANVEIAKQYDIQGYPTIKLLSVNNEGALNLYDYDDERQLGKLEQFINLMTNQ